MSSDQKLLEADRQARRDALDIGRSFIVQAPAGSGKTELLIQRYLKLLATVDSPEEILAITFTRKAASEMRLRVLEALEQAQSGAPADAPHKQITLDAATAVLARDTSRSWQLITQPRRMRIQTLDSLNASIARMLPVTAAGASAGSSVADDSEMSALYREAAAATLDWLGEAGGVHEATQDVLLHVDTDTGVYVEYLSRMLRTRDQWLPFISSGSLTKDEADALRSNFEKNLEQVVVEKLLELSASAPRDLLSDLFALIPYAAANLRDADTAEHAMLTLDGIAELPNPSPDDLPLWRALADVLLTNTGTVRKQVNKNQGFPPQDSGEKQRMSDVLERLAEHATFVARLQNARHLPPVQYSDEQWQVLLALFRLLPTAVGEFRRLCSSRGVTDYIEIAMGAGTALGTAESPGDIALLLDYQVRHILVDEMQDTSRAQYRMLEALTGGWEEGDGRTLFCVGDPMQSIYRFRNAEVAQFLLARRNGIGSMRLDPLVLRRNFRSGEHLVHWFNGVFPSVLPEHDDPFNGAVSYSEAVAAEQHRGQGSIAVHPVFGSRNADEAVTASSLISELLRSNPGDDIAVLVRQRTQLPELLSHLRDAGIGYQAIDIDRLTDLPEVIDLLALTRALAHPGDRIAWLGLLRSPWVGLDWTDLWALVYGANRATIPELLGDEARLERMSDAGRSALERALPALRRALLAGRSEPFHQRIERAWFELGGPALLADASAVANVNHFIDSIARIEVGGTLEDVAELESQLDEDRVSTSAAARVQVLTMHKAKGLQFDHVVLYGLGRHPAGANKSVMIWYDLPDTHGVEEKVISPVGPREAVERDPVHRFIELTEAAKDDHETGRLLYVACTRAIKSLHLVGHVGVKPDGSEYRPAHARSLLSLLWPTVESDFGSAWESGAVSAGQDECQTWFEPVLRRIDPQWTLPAPAPLPVEQVADKVEGEHVDYYWVGVDARLAGTIVHRWLQLAAEGKVDLQTELDALHGTTERWLEELGASSDAAERVHAALSRVAADEKAQWILSGEGKAELALSGVVNRQIRSIVIDRVRVDEDGTHWIVDYKTSSHEGGDLDGFLAAESDRYREQLSIYAQLYGAWTGKPVRCALYFPLLSRFVEVDVGSEFAH